MRNPVTIVVIIAVVVIGAVMLARAGDRPVTLDDRATTSDAAAPLAAADLSFVTSAAESGNAEIQMAQLAQRRSERAEVDALADRIERDHKAANDRLEDLADRRDVDFAGDAVGLPGPNDMHKATYDRLEDLEGAAFERAWAEQMVKDHQQAVEAFTKAAESTDPDVKAFAESTLPGLKEHLQASQDLHRQLSTATR